MCPWKERFKRDRSRSNDREYGDFARLGIVITNLKTPHLLTGVEKLDSLAGFLHE